MKNTRCWIVASFLQGSMYPISIDFGLKVVPKKVLWAQSIYYLGTWTLGVQCKSAHGPLNLEWPVLEPGSLWECAFSTFPHCHGIESIRETNKNNTIRKTSLSRHKSVNLHPKSFC